MISTIPIGSDKFLYTIISNISLFIIKCQIWMKILIQFTFHLLINRFYTFGLIHWGLTGKSTFNAHNSNCPDHMYKHTYAFYSENLTLIFWTGRGLTQYIQDAYLFLEPVDGPLPLGWDLHQVVLHWSTLTGQADQELDTSVGSPAVCGMIQSHGGWSKPWNSLLKYSNIKFLHCLNKRHIEHLLNIFYSFLYTYIT